MPPTLLITAILFVVLFVCRVVLCAIKCYIDSVAIGNASWLPGPDAPESWTNQNWTPTFASMYFRLYMMLSMEYGTVPRSTGEASFNSTAQKADGAEQTDPQRSRLTLECRGPTAPWMRWQDACIKGGPGV